MTTKFGWCLDGRHANCPYVSGERGDYEAFCSCDCHWEPDASTCHTNTEGDNT